MEETNGQGVRMADIAKAAHVSRQAVYLHFKNRIELISATTTYVDEVKGLDDRLKKVQEASSGKQMLDVYIDEWGRYLEEIYGLAKALFETRHSDDASAAAWAKCMACHNQGCRDIIKVLHQDKALAADWSVKEAGDMLCTSLSFQTWEQLIIEHKWSVEQYVSQMTRMLNASLLA